MRRVPPSTAVREEIAELLDAGTERGTKIVSALAELGLRYVTQRGLEQEQEDFLGRVATSAVRPAEDGATGTRTRSCAAPRGRSPCAFLRSGASKVPTGPG